jgi:hypothetical protein
MVRQLLRLLYADQSSLNAPATPRSLYFAFSFRTYDRFLPFGILTLRMTESRTSWQWRVRVGEVIPMLGSTSGTSVRNQCAAERRHVGFDFKHRVVQHSSKCEQGGCLHIWIAYYYHELTNKAFSTLSTSDLPECCLKTNKHTGHSKQDMSIDIQDNLILKSACLHRGIGDKSPC